MKYNKLFEKGKIGSLKIKNRIVMTAAGCGLANMNGTVTEELLAYYEERAKGGVGAIITEVVRVDEESGVMNDHQLNATDDKFIPELKRLADSMHQYDCKLFLQLQHPGNVTNSSNLNGRIPVSSSNKSSLLFEQSVEELSIEKIKKIISNFGDAAFRVKCAGVDGIELHGAHFYLIHQFLTPYFNKRTDEYGGSHENRMRFLKEIVEDVRKKCGKDFPLIVRISVEDYLGNEGYHLNEGIKICQDLESYGVDAIDVTAAGAGCKGGQSLEPVSFAQGWRKHLPASIKKFVKIPVISVALVREPEFAEQLLEEEKLDFVGSARCHLADPNWSNKAKEGKTNEICKCISCLKCIDGIKNGESISCSVNAECGRELMKTQLKINGNGQKVIVIGSGPAGMEAARLAAIRGFEVSIFEKAEYLGGQLYLAAQAPKKEKMYWYIEHQKQQLINLNVNIKLGVDASINMLQKENPYGIIDASGATAIIPRGIGADKEFVCIPEHVLLEKIKIENENVIIIGSGMTGLETAEFLVEHNNIVTLIEMDCKVAKLAYPTQVSDILPKLEIANTVIMTDTALVSIEDGYIVIKDMRTDEKSVLPADRIVLSLGVRSQNNLKEQLKDSFDNVFVVGDALKSGRVFDAVLSGYQAAINL